MFGRTVGPMEMPKNARQMFENFTKAYAQLQEQISAIHHHQSENGEGHSDIRDGSGEGSNNGVGIVRGILYIRDSMNFALSALKKLLTLGMQTNGQNIWKVSSKS